MLRTEISRTADIASLLDVDSHTLRVGADISNPEMSVVKTDTRTKKRIATIAAFHNSPRFAKLTRLREDDKGMLSESQSTWDFALRDGRHRSAAPAFFKTVGCRQKKTRILANHHNTFLCMNLF